MRTRLTPVLLLATLLCAAPLLAAQADLRSVAGMKDHNRVLLVFAPDLRDPRLEEERKMMGRFALGAAERDLLLVQVGQGTVLGAHDREDKLRQKYRTPPQRFHVVLLGKDGSVALESSVPIDEHRLQQTIDAMPMRREEMRHAAAGHPLPKKY